MSHFLFVVNVIILTAFMLGVGMLNVIMLSVVYAKCNN
jgi:hypothetical protein